MVELFAVGLFGLLGAYALVDLFDAADDGKDEDAPPEEPQPDPDVDETGAYLVGGGDTVIGTEGDDTFVRDPDAESFRDVVVEAGAGDDTIALYDPETDGDAERFTLNFDRSTLNGGDGNDTIDVFVTNSQIHGGNGDDIINMHEFAGNAQAYGGAGNDALWAEQNYGDSVVMDGGAGNDTIDARLVWNLDAIGGEGNDTILVSNANQPGAGYVISADGGAGDDLIRFEGSAVTSDIFEAQTALGGEGADTFSISFDEGDEPTSEEDAAPGFDTTRFEVIRLGDFEPGVDRLEVDPQVKDSGFEVAGARMEEDSDAGTTELIFTYSNPEAEDREIFITLAATGLTWDDVIFLGETPPLEALA